LEKVLILHNMEQKTLDLGIVVDEVVDWMLGYSAYGD
jgi:hypothetical protein